MVKMPKLRSAPLLVFTMLLGIITWAGLRANAAWHFYAVQSIAEPLFTAGTGDATAFEEAGSHLNSALKRFPNNPDYLDFAGHVDVLRAAQPGVVGGERRKLLESAAADYRHALSVRPLWPYSWINLLAVKDSLGQVDEEFRQALKRAAETGPWEPRVQLQIIRSGLGYWSVLTSGEREAVRRRVQDALKVQPREVFLIVRDYGRPDLVCNAESGYRQIKDWCFNVS